MRLNLTLCFILILLVFVSLAVGKFTLNPLLVFEFGQQGEIAKIIIFEIRLPRTILAVFAGGSLAMVGAALQAYLRNPLADPGILGISSFSSLGAVIAVYFGFSSVIFLPLLSFSFAIFAVLILLFLSSRQNNSLNFILAGIVLSLFGGALITLALNFAPNPYAIAELIDWQIGAFSNANWQGLYFAMPMIFLGSLFILYNANSFDALGFGFISAKSLGVNVKKLSFAIIVASGLIIGAVTSLCGIISFVGLMVAHFIRPLVGNQPSKTILPSFLAGGIFCLICDIFVRLIPTTSEIKIGAIMALLGGPFFLYLILKKRFSNDFAG